MQAQATMPPRVTKISSHAQSSRRNRARPASRRFTEDSNDDVPKSAVTDDDSEHVGPDQDSQDIGGSGQSQDGFTGLMVEMMQTVSPPLEMKTTSRTLDFGTGTQSLHYSSHKFVV